MIRAVVSTVALTGVVGFTLGWLAFAPRQSPSPEPTERELAELTHRFALLSADVNCDRETPALAVDGAGRVFLAWASQTGELERTLWLARSLDGGVTFEPPLAFRKVGIDRQVRKMNGKERVFTTNVLPRLAVHQAVLHLGWVQAKAGGRVECLLAQSSDGGETFSDPRPVHGDQATRPGYTAMAVDAEGTIVSAWLDGRNKSQQPFCSVSTPGAKQFLPESLVYAGEERGICPCCDVAAIRAQDGSTFVAFRNAQAGYRDIWVARAGAKAASGFEAAVPVSADNWRFDGCPHDGPSLAVTDERLHVTWMDAHSGKRRIYVANSTLASLSFAPQELHANAPGEQGHPKISADSNAMLHLVWDGSLDDDASEPLAEEGQHHHHHGMRLQGTGRAIYYTRSPDGTNFALPRMIAPRSGVFQIQPALAVDANGVVHVAWNEMTAEGKSVVFARLGQYLPPCCVKK